MPADSASLAELERVSRIYRVLVVGLLLHRVEKLAALMGRANSVDKVVKLSHYSKLAKLLELVIRRCSSKLLFPLAHPITV
jgi:hypothetical protein